MAKDHKKLRDAGKALQDYSKSSKDAEKARESLRAAQSNAKDWDSQAKAIRSTGTELRKQVNEAERARLSQAQMRQDVDATKRSMHAQTNEMVEARKQMGKLKVAFVEFKESVAEFAKENKDAIINGIGLAGLALSVKMLNDLNSSFKKSSDLVQNSLTAQNMAIGSNIESIHALKEAQDEVFFRSLPSARATGGRFAMQDIGGVETAESVHAQLLQSQWFTKPGELENAVDAVMETSTLVRGNLTPEEVAEMFIQGAEKGFTPEAITAQMVGLNNAFFDAKEAGVDVTSISLAKEGLKENGPRQTEALLRALIDLNSTMELSNDEQKTILEDMPKLIKELGDSLVVRGSVGDKLFNQIKSDPTKVAELNRELGSEEMIRVRRYLEKDNLSDVEAADFNKLLSGSSMYTQEIGDNLDKYAEVKAGSLNNLIASSSSEKMALIADQAADRGIKFGQILGDAYRESSKGASVQEVKAAKRNAGLFAIGGGGLVDAAAETGMLGSYEELSAMEDTARSVVENPVVKGGLSILGAGTAMNAAMSQGADISKSDIAMASTKAFLGDPAELAALNQKAEEHLATNGSSSGSMASDTSYEDAVQMHLEAARLQKEVFSDGVSMGGDGVGIGTTGALVVGGAALGAAAGYAAGSDSLPDIESMNPFSGGMTEAEKRSKLARTKAQSSSATSTSSNASQTKASTFNPHTGILRVEVDVPIGEALAQMSESGDL